MAEHRGSAGRPTRLAPLFTWRSAIAETDLHPSARLVALTLSLHMSERGDGCFPSLATLLAETGLARQTVIDAIKSLEAGGLLEVKRGRGRGNPNRYRALIPDSMIEEYLRARPKLAETVLPLDHSAGEEKVSSLDHLPEDEADKRSTEQTVGRKEDLRPSSPTARATEVEPLKANDLVAAFVDESRRRGSDPPAQVRGHLARQIGKLLAEGIAPERIAAGLGRMLDRRIVQPALLPNFVAEAELPAAGSSRRRGLTAGEIMALYAEPKP